MKSTMVLRLTRFFLIWCFTVVIHFLPGTFHFLTEPGIFCCDKYLSIEAPKLSAQQKKIAITVPNTREQQDALGKASTTGAQFYANAGGCQFS